MAKLTHDVEIEIQKHMDKLERRVQQAGETVDQLGPQIDRLRDGLARVEDYLSHDLDHALKRSDDSINTGLSNADNLQQLLSIMIKTILESNSHIAAAQEKSLALVSQKNDGLNILTVAVATAASSAAALGNQIVGFDHSHPLAARLPDHLDSRNCRASRHRSLLIDNRW